jgi:hypothetical protein
MKHPLFFVEVWKRDGGGLVVRSEKTDSAERAKRMALELGAVEKWYPLVWIEYPDNSVDSLLECELARLNTM